MEGRSGRRWAGGAGNLPKGRYFTWPMRSCVCVCRCAQRELLMSSGLRTSYHLVVARKVMVLTNLLSGNKENQTSLKEFAMSGGKQGLSCV